MQTYIYFHVCKERDYNKMKYTCWFELKSEWAVEACQGYNMQHVSMIKHAVKQEC